MASATGVFPLLCALVSQEYHSQLSKLSVARRKGEILASERTAAETFTSLIPDLLCATYLPSFTPDCCSLSPIFTNHGHKMITAARLTTAVNQNGRRFLSSPAPRLIAADPLRFHSPSIVRHLHCLRTFQHSLPADRISRLRPKSYRLLDALRPPLAPFHSGRDPFTHTRNPVVHPPGHPPPFPRTQSRGLSTQPNLPQNVFSFNRAWRKNVSYFRGRSPWRNASQSPWPSKPDPLAAKRGDGAPKESRHLLDRLPDLSQRFHRPTKEELLAAATGFWSRLRIRFKWFSIRSLRPFNMDDISAFFSWFLVGHVIWILVGTTTFFSLLIFAVNTVLAQGERSSDRDATSVY